MPEMDPLDEVTQDCVEACTECELVSKEAVAHCLQMGGRHVEAEHVKLLLDCGEVCTTGVAAMLRRSEFSAQICSLCADVCDRCAESCDQLAEDDEWMRDCAEVCRNCSAACRALTDEGGEEEEIAA